MKLSSPTKQLAGFIAKFDAPIGRLIKASHKALRARLPGACELVYDNYNFFVIGFGPTERASEAILSIAAYARGVNLCFIAGAKLKDPQKLLRGSGKTVRNVIHKDAEAIRSPEIENFIAQALKIAKWRVSKGGENRLIIKSVSAKQRPRKLPKRKQEKR